MAKPVAVLILYNLPRAAGGPGGERWAASDAGVLDEVEAVAAALASQGTRFRKAGVRTLAEVPDALAGGDESVVFNLVEELDGGPVDACLIPAVCRAAGRSCTGSDTPCLLLCADKWQTKACLAAGGVDTPEACMVRPGEAPVLRDGDVVCLMSPIAGG